MSNSQEYLEAKTETGVPASFLKDARVLEKRWELKDRVLPVSEVLGSGVEGFDNLSEFLGKRKSESFNYVKTSATGNSELDIILGTTTSDDVKYVNAQVNNLSMLSMYDTFLGIYMSPNGAFTDINFRLGKVSKTLLKNKASSQVNSDGSMYTRSNFNKRFDYKLNKSFGNYFYEYNTKLSYSNLFFPPYASPSDPNKSFLSTYINSANRSTRNGTSSTPWMTYYRYLKNSSKMSRDESLSFDESNFTIKRDASFTYRHAGFKSINDNITFLQWVFENTTGVVSTYLTEWDMSVYFQEGFIPNKENQRLSLLYRIEKDNPMKDFPTYNDKTTHPDNLNYLNFGVINSSVSLETNNLKWNIDKFPLSRYWTKYPLTYMKEELHSEDYEEQQILLSSDILPESEKAIIRLQIAMETEVLYSPDFYNVNSLNPSVLYKDTSSLFDRIEYCDRRGAALSGWWSWNMNYYKALYTVSGNELSNLDASNMIEPASNVYDVARANHDEGSIDNENATTGSGTGAGTSGYGSSGGGRKWYKSKKPKSGKSGASAAKAKGNKFVSSSIYMGISEDVITENENISGTETFDETASLQYSDSTGMSDSNPVFYGGPHGAGRSPKNPKSFFEINNPLLRNFPRIDPPTNFDSKDLTSYLNGLNQFYSYKTQYGSNEWMETNRVKGVSENSLVGGLSLLKNGVQEKRFMLTMKKVKKYIDPISDYARNEKVVTYFKKRRSSKLRKYTSYQYLDQFPSHIYTYNGQSTGWHKLYYVSAVTSSVPLYPWWTPRFKSPSNNYNAGYDEDKNGTVDKAYTSRSYNYNHYWGSPYSVKSKQAYYYTYEWGWSERYMLHGEPYTQWTMTELSYNNYTTSIPFSKFAYWFSVFKRYRSSVVTYIKTLGTTKKRIELKGTGYWATQRNFGDSSSQTVRWTSGTIRIQDWFVKNSREFGTDNYLTFFAGNNIYNSKGMRAPDAIFQTTVAMKEYSFVYSYGASERHRCHHHSVTRQAVGWREYIDVGLYDNDEKVPFSLLSTNQEAWTNLYSSDVFENLGPTPSYARKYNDISQLFSNGQLKGCGIYSSLQGFDPSLDETDGTNYPKLLSIKNLSNTRFCDVKFNYFNISNYAISPRLSAGGYSYYPVGGVERYRVKKMPKEQSTALIRGMVSAGLYQSTRNESYLCYGDAPFRLLYSQLCNQVQFYKVAQNAILSKDVLPVANIREMLLKCVDPSVIKVSCKDFVTYDNEDTKYNYWIERAFTHFNKSNTQINEYIDLIKTELSGVIGKYESFIKLLKPLISKHILNWTYNEYSKAILEYLPVIKSSVVGDLKFDEFFYSYLNILYEYRRYFINKRFNKVDGTFYQLRHLEGLLSYMKAKTSTGEISSLDFSGDTKAEDINVSFYTINHTAEQKTKALLSGVALKPDEILKLYIPVTYSTEEKYLKELKKKKEDDTYIMKVQKTTRLGSDKIYAEIPVDHTYKLISDQYTKNEGNKQINKVMTENYISKSIDSKGITLITVANPDYSNLIKLIYWGDSPSLTPIEENVSININATGLIDSLSVTEDIHEAVCAARELQDFWTVNVSSKNCQSRGYKTGLKLIPYILSNSSTSLKPTVEESAMGISANQLWPITEEQSQITTMNSISESQKLKVMSSTGLETGSEYY